MVKRQNEELQKITERQIMMERQIQEQGTVQAELNRKLDVLMHHIMSSSQPRNKEAVDEQHSSIGEPRVDEPKLPTNQEEQQAVDAQPSEGRRLRKRGRRYQSPYVEFPLKKKKSCV